VGCILSPVRGLIFGIEVVCATAHRALFRERLAAHGLQAGFVEHPLDGAVEQHGVIEVGDLAVEPEVNAGDRGGLEVGEHLA
jgi:hypothetical protein